MFKNFAPLAFSIEKYAGWKKYTSAAGGAGGQ